jgi:FkbM family methyltransferase
MCLIPGDIGLSKQLIEEGGREKCSTEFIDRILKPDWTVIEVGANLGYYALLEARKVKKVYAIEPIEQSIKALKESIKLNGYKNIKVYQLAISDKDGISKITTSARSNWATMVNLKGTRAGYQEKFNRFKSVTQKIDTMTLDSFIEREGIDKVDLIRMDTEGYEVEIIRGMDKTFDLMPKGSYLSVEFHPAIYDDRFGLIETLNKILRAGFSIELITTHDRGYKLTTLALKKWLLKKGACPQVFFRKV